MELTPQVVAAYQELMTRPIENGITTIKPLSEIFEETEQATPKHELFEAYNKIIGGMVPKLIFYIVMDNLYKTAKSPSGYLGYCIKIRT